MRFRGGAVKSFAITMVMMTGLAITRERMAMFERMLAELRKTARPQEWQDLSSGYRLEIERMQREILDYLVH